jgi:hypothetical protein
VTFVHIHRDRTFQKWEENKTGLAKKTLLMKRRKGNALPYLEAVAITFFTRQSGFLQFIQGKLDLLRTRPLKMKFLPKRRIKPDT